jgi:hypothetical protein
MRGANEASSERPAHLPRFTLRGAMTLYSVLAVIFSIPLVGLGFTVTACILAVLLMLQFPLLFLFGAFALADTRVSDDQEDDESREP